MRQNIYSFFTFEQNFTNKKNAAEGGGNPVYSQKARFIFLNKNAKIKFF
jgi:hypothetical protein